MLWTFLATWYVQQYHHFASQCSMIICCRNGLLLLLDCLSNAQLYSFSCRGILEGVQRPQTTECVCPLNNWHKYWRRIKVNWFHRCHQSKNVTLEIIDSCFGFTGLSMKQFHIVCLDPRPWCPQWLTFTDTFHSVWQKSLLYWVHIQWKDKTFWWCPHLLTA